MRTGDQVEPSGGVRLARRRLTVCVRVTFDRWDHHR